MKGDKVEGKPHHISIPPKDAIAIVPPKKVPFPDLRLCLRATIICCVEVGLPGA